MCPSPHARPPGVLGSRHPLRRTTLTAPRVPHRTSEFACMCKLILVPWRRRPEEEAHAPARRTSRARALGHARAPCLRDTGRARRGDPARRARPRAAHRGGPPRVGGDHGALPRGRHLQAHAAGALRRLRVRLFRVHRDEPRDRPRVRVHELVREPGHGAPVVHRPVSARGAGGSLARRPRRHRRGLLRARRQGARGAGRLDDFRQVVVALQRRQLPVVHARNAVPARAGGRQARGGFRARARDLRAHRGRLARRRPQGHGQQVHRDRRRGVPAAASPADVRAGLVLRGAGHLGQHQSAPACRCA